MQTKNSLPLPLLLEHHFYRVLRKLYKATLPLRKNPRPSSYPYITGDSFRVLADHIHDETGSFDPALVKRGDIVFVGSPTMHDYFTHVHPNIKEEYILIEHNGDIQVDGSITPFIDEKIYKFYAQIVLVAHEKIIPIPIGINNMHHGVDGFSWLMHKKPPAAKRARIFYHFNNVTNPKERTAAAAYFATHPLLETITSYIPISSYKDLLATYMFTASPAGNTLGSHRTWEALYLKTIPIVKRTVDAESCAARGLPLWILDDWHELDAYDEEKLKAKYVYMMKTADFAPLYMDYWINLIKSDQTKLRSTKPKNS